MFCRKCGKENKKSTKFCVSCGAPLIGAAPISVKEKIILLNPSSKRWEKSGGKSKIVAGWLAIFLGIFGVHKFYLGKIGIGILYLVFFWTYIPSIIGLIEGIIYLTKTDEEWVKYCKKILPQKK